MRQQHDPALALADPASPSAFAVTVNGRDYELGSRPVVVICADGCARGYFDAAIAAGRAPTFAKMRATGHFGAATAAMPTFTNPNNVSIVTGAPPSIHGISGNFTLDRATRTEVMMLDDAGMIGDTIPGALSRAGARVAVITAKDKLRKALSRGLDGLSGSAEQAEALRDQVGPGLDGPAPDKYSADLSLFVLDAAVALLDAGTVDLAYLSLSDFVQHAHAPEALEAIAYMAAMDRRVGAILEAGAVVAIVADHGMTDMARENGSPNVVWVGDILNAAFGAGRTRVICPITDPFGRHHASLGGYVRVYVFDPTVDPEKARALLADHPGIDLALRGAEAARRFDLPAAAEGDIAVVGRRGVALGACEADHDQAQLAGARLRSHGSLAEQEVPFLLSEPLQGERATRYAAEARVWDIFDAALNGVKA